MTRRLITCGLMSLALGLVFAVGCSHSTAKTKRGQRIERLLKLEVVEPLRKRIQRRVKLAATVEALAKVDVSARVPGVVEKLDSSMDLGRRVKEGEVMLVLDVPELKADLAQKKALVAQTEKQKRLARESWDVAVKEVEETKAEDKRFSAEVDFNSSRLKRIAALVKQRAQDPQLEEEARRQVEAARSALAANKAKAIKRQARVQAAIAEYELSEERIKVAKAEVKRLEALVEFATIKAPFDGVITERKVDRGAIIKDPGTVLFTVMKMDRVRVLVDVTQRDVQMLNTREQNPNPDGKGDHVQVFFRELAELPNRGTFEGTITRVSRSLDPVTRTMRGEIELPNPDLLLKPGMFGEASILVEDRSDVLTVPASALVRRGEGLVEVYVVEDAASTGSGDERRGILRTRPVVLGIDDGKEVEIREGLKGDELVVARSTGVIRANDAVLAVTQREAER